MKNCNYAQTFLELDLSTILQGLSIVEDRVKSILAVENELYKCCEQISALYGLANDLVVFGLPKQALYVSSTTPKVYKIKTELYSKEQVDDGFGHPIPARVIFVNIQTLSPTEEAVYEALKNYLDEYYIGGYSMPYEEIDEKLMF
ncbi:MAG: hypothetical protein QNJ54_22885 [Prochloraceae cyanobacterium]|nr:hypothetical protein [Prochloraceae cyanobacterium]